MDTMTELNPKSTHKNKLVSECEIYILWLPKDDEGEHYIQIESLEHL